VTDLPLRTRKDVGEGDPSCGIAALHEHCAPNFCPGMLPLLMHGCREYTKDNTLMDTGAVRSTKLCHGSSG